MRKNSKVSDNKEFRNITENDYQKLVHQSKFDEIVKSITQKNSYLEVEIHNIKIMQEKLENFLEKYITYEMKKMVKETVDSYINNDENKLAYKNELLKMNFYTQSILCDKGKPSELFLNKIKSANVYNIEKENPQVKEKEVPTDNNLESKNINITNNNDSKLVEKEKSLIEKTNEKIDTPNESKKNDSQEIRKEENSRKKIEIKMRTKPENPDHKDSNLILKSTEIKNYIESNLKSIKEEKDLNTKTIMYKIDNIKSELMSKLSNIERQHERKENEMFERFNILHNNMDSQMKNRLNDIKNFVN